MCGIVGIAGLNPLEPVDEARLKIMRDVLRHRGPDGEGLWTEAHVGLGFRRLAIIDVEGGAQPMPNEDGSVWVVFNGEIYNHAKLRPWLEARGHHYRTRSDSGAIVPEFLANRYVAGAETFFRGVMKLLPGRTLTWSAREGVRERRYWRLPAEVNDTPTTPVEAAGMVRAGLEAAVRSHLMSDVPL